MLRHRLHRRVRGPERAGAALRVDPGLTARDMDRIRQALGEPEDQLRRIQLRQRAGRDVGDDVPLHGQGGRAQRRARRQPGLERMENQAKRHRGWSSGHHARAQTNVRRPTAAAPSTTTGGQTRVRGPLGGTGHGSRGWSLARDRPPVNQILPVYAVASRVFRNRYVVGRAVPRARRRPARRRARVLEALRHVHGSARRRRHVLHTLVGFVAISCLDDNGPTDPAEYPAVDARLRQAAPLDGLRSPRLQLPPARPLAGALQAPASAPHRRRTPGRSSWWGRRAIPSRPSSAPDPWPPRLQARSAPHRRRRAPHRVAGEFVLPEGRSTATSVA